ncbi:MAG: AAA family ATPase [Bryobacteraceae bacterium]|nr:AAA family ATPase [Bryobacteraceae bacterium]
MKEFPPFRLDPVDESLWRGDERVHLTPKAFAVLRYLVERAGRLVTQHELLEALWPGTFVQPEVLKSQILDVRAALGDRAKDPLFIETVQRRGYRFIAEVREPATAAAGDAGPPGRRLVAREGPMAALQACLAKAAEGWRQVVFVTGEQGIGKSTLVQAFLDELPPRGAVVARGQCLEGFGAVREPYYPVLEAMGHVAAATGDALTRVLEKQAPTWLVQLPALLTREHRETLQRELTGATRERMIREMCEALEKLTESAVLVLVLEDLHWSDHATIDLLDAVARRRAGARLMVVGTYRPVDVVVGQHPLKQASQSLKAGRLAQEVALSPLSEGEVGKYLSLQGGQGAPAIPELARWIRKQTDGNPLFVVTVIEYLVEAGHVELTSSGWQVRTPLDSLQMSIPDSLRQLIDLQIDRLSPLEQLTLEAASVHGAVFSATVTAAALQVDAEGVEDTCQKLARHHHMVRTAEVDRLPDGNLSPRYEFTHAAFRNVFYHRVGPARRAKLHGRIGEALESIFTGQRAEMAAELAGHFEQCGDWARAVEYLWLAATKAWQRLAYRESLAILERALEAAGKLPAGERAAVELRILERLAVVQNSLHDFARAIPTLERLAQLAAAAGVKSVEARALSLLSVILSTDDAHRCQPLLERLSALADQTDEELLRAQIRSQQATMRISIFGWQPQLAQEIARHLAAIRNGGDRLAIASHSIDHSFVQWASSEYRASIQSAEEALPVLLESGRLVRYLQGREVVAVDHAMLGEWGRALDGLDECIQHAQANDAPFRLLLPLILKAWVHVNAGDCEGALAICQQALPSLAGVFLRDRRWLALQVQASAECRLGAHDQALAKLVEIRSEREARPAVFSWYWQVPLQIQLGDALLAKRDVLRARSEADRAVTLAGDTAEQTWKGLAWELSARIADAEGSRERAEHDLSEALKAIEGFEAPLAAVRIHGTAAKLRKSEQHLVLRQQIVQAIAASLESRPALRQIFLASYFTASPASA